MESIAILLETHQYCQNIIEGYDVHSHGWSSRNLILDATENLPTKRLKVFKFPSNFRGLHAVDLIRCENRSRAGKKVLFLWDIENAPLLLVHLALALVYTESVE